MIVWIVEGGFDYEGVSVLGVFDSYTKATQCQIEHEGRGQFAYDYVRIVEWEVV